MNTQKIRELLERLERCENLLNDDYAGETAYFDLAKECYGWLVTVPEGSPPAVPDTSAWSGQDARRRIEAFVHHAAFQLAKETKALLTSEAVEGELVRGDVVFVRATISAKHPDGQLQLAINNPHGVTRHFWVNPGELAALTKEPAQPELECVLCAGQGLAKCECVGKPAPASPVDVGERAWADKQFIENVVIELRTPCDRDDFDNCTNAPDNLDATSNQAADLIESLTKQTHELDGLVDTFAREKSDLAKELTESRAENALLKDKWVPGNPEKPGYCLAVWEHVGRRIVSELWFNPDAAPKWWNNRGYLTEPRPAIPFNHTVICHRPMPEPPVKQGEEKPL